MQRAQGKKYTFDYERYSQSKERRLESPYCGICFVDIYNQALQFREFNLMKVKTPWLMTVTTITDLISALSPSVVVAAIFLAVSTLHCAYQQKEVDPQTYAQTKLFRYFEDKTEFPIVNLPKSTQTMALNIEQMPLVELFYRVLGKNGLGADKVLVMRYPMKWCAVLLQFVHVFRPLESLINQIYRNE